MERNAHEREEWVPSLSGKESLILEMLLQKPSSEMYGLELVKHSGGRLKRGTVYVTLGRMESKGYITSQQEEVPEGSTVLPRRLYRVSGFGQKVFDAFKIAKEAQRLFAVPAWEIK